MFRVTRQLLETHDGHLPEHDWPGGYPLFYLDRDDCILCPNCANELPEAEKLELYCGINWEEHDLFCNFCGSRIESAYAEELTEKERALIKLLRSLKISPKLAVRMIWAHHYDSREKAKASGYDALANLYKKDLDKIKFLAKAAGLWEE